MTPTPASPPQLFNCPTCGASLPVPDEDPSVRCAYCGSNVLVPPEYRKPPASSGSQTPLLIQVSSLAEPQAVEVSEAEKRRARWITSVILIVVVACVVVGIIASLLATAGAFTTAAVVNQVIEQEANPPAIRTEIQVSPTPSPNPDYSFLLQFGSEGSGAGQFDDSRYLAVEANGNIHTAEYQDGRLQTFSPNGQFQRLVNVEPDNDGYITISDMATDYSGRLLIARRGDILLYSAADGTLTGTIAGEFPDTRYGALAVDPANMIYALHIAAGELDLIKLDPSGQPLWRKAQITQGLIKPGEISTVSRLAVDGLGNIYLLDNSQHQVYHFDSTGNFVDRFGSKGKGAGWLDRPEDLAVDGQGRIYILDQDGIEIFDHRGNHLKLVPDDYEGHAFDIKVDMQGDVYLITNAPRVYKLRLNLER